MIATATALPPFTPRVVMDGIESFETASLDSAALTKPTGVAIMRAGLASFWLIISTMVRAAVGEFPMMTILLFIPSSAAIRIAAAVRVIFAVSAKLIALS